MPTVDEFVRRALHEIETRMLSTDPLFPMFGERAAADPPPPATEAGTEAEPAQAAPADPPPPAEVREPAWYVWTISCLGQDGLRFATSANRSGPFRDRDLAEEVAAEFCAKPHVLCATVESY